MTGAAHRVEHGGGTGGLEKQVHALAAEASGAGLPIRLVPSDAFGHLERNDAEAFLRARLAYLDDLEREFMRVHGVTPPKIGEPPAASPIDTDD